MRIENFRVYSTAVTALAAGDTLDLSVSTPGQPHVFMGVEFFTSSAGTVLATPTAGTLTFLVKTVNLPNTWQTLPDSVSLAAVNEQVGVSANIIAVRVSGLSGVSGGSATHCKLIASTNLS